MQGVKVNVEAQNLPSLVPGRLRKQFPRSSRDPKYLAMQKTWNSSQEIANWLAEESLTSVELRHNARVSFPFPPFMLHCCMSGTIKKILHTIPIFRTRLRVITSSNFLGQGHSLALSKWKWTLWGKKINMQKLPSPAPAWQVPFHRQKVYLLFVDRVVSPFYTQPEISVHQGTSALLLQTTQTAFKFHKIANKYDVLLTFSIMLSNESWESIAKAIRMTSASI